MQRFGINLISNEFIYSFSPSAGKKDSEQAQSTVKDWITLGWEIMEKLLDANVFKHMLNLNEDPTPILKAMERFPFTLIHGDFKPDNLAYTDRFIILDWQLATFSIMTADLAWLTRTLEDLIEEKISIQIYRQYLEAHLKLRFDDIDWRAMVELGYAVDALRSTSLIAYWSNEKRVRSQGQLVMDALRWL